MRNVLIIAVALFAFVGLAGAGETARVELLEGLYSVEAPVEWYVEEFEDGQGTMFAESKDSPYKLVFATPIPDIDDIAVFTGLMVGSMYKQLGGEGKVIAEKQEEFNGNPAVQALFAVRRPDNTGFAGLINTVNYDGFTVTMLAVGPADGVETFVQKSEAIMKSYEVDIDALKENREHLAEIGEAMGKELMEVLGK